MENSEKKISLEFTGTVWELFGWSLLSVIGSLFVIPAPWVIAGLYRWFADKTKLSDQTAVSFSGQVNQIWFPIMAIPALTYLAQFLDISHFILLPLECYFSFVIARWLIKNLVFSCGSNLEFEGAFFPYLGWKVLIQLLIFTIIGWAWGTSGFLKWFCQKIKSDNIIVEFHGSGWEIFWRTVTFIFCCLLIIPIPWISLWLVQWYVSQITFQRIDETSG